MMSLTVEFPARPAVPSQRDRVMSLLGKWRDSRSEQEIISEIEGARSFGREVAL